MDFDQLKEQFLRNTGRYDLSTSDIALYFERGQRRLGLRLKVPVEMAYNQIAVPSGEQILLVDNCRAVLSVWANDSSGGVQKISYEDNWERLLATSSGFPILYGVSALRHFPPLTLLSEEQRNDLDIKVPVLPTDGDCLGVFLWPKPDTNIQVAINGLFHPPFLNTTVAVNFYSINYPEALLLATCQVLEGDYRNTAGVQDYELQLSAMLRDIDIEQASQDNDINDWIV